MELESKIGVCIIGKMISVPNITDAIIADACWKTPTVRFLSSVKSFKYFFKRWVDLALKILFWASIQYGPSYKKKKSNWALRHSDGHWDKILVHLLT